MFQNGHRIAHSPEKRPHSVLWGILPKTALLSLSWAQQPSSDALWRRFFVFFVDFLSTLTKKRVKMTPSQSNKRNRTTFVRANLAIFLFKTEILADKVLSVCVLQLLDRLGVVELDLLGLRHESVYALAMV